MTLERLQRGLGSGRQWAIANRRGEEVAACIREDPRWDRQLDSRAEYYARLALALGVPVSPEDDLGLPVLGRMAIHGDAAARRALREYVAEGDEWAAAIEQLGHDFETGGPAPDAEAAVAGLDAVLADRFGDDLETALLDAATYGDVLRRWPRFAEILGGGEDGDGWHTRSDLAALPTDALLELERPHEWRLAGMVLGGRPEDAEEIVGAAHDPGHAMRLAAIRALGTLARPELIPLARSLIAAAPGRQLGLVIGDAIEALPFALSRELALEWLTDPDWRRRRIAARTLAAHAGAEDAGAARAALEAELELRDQYVICSLAQALARVPDAGPAPALREAYETMPYSYGRHFVVEAIKVTDPSFPSTLAPECRYDCESVTRELAGSSTGSHNDA
jgi:hypothetical protein